MGTADVINLEQLLEPVSAEHPTGTDPREDFAPTSAYRVLKDARAQVRALERELVKGEEGAGGGGSPDWRPIIDSAQKVLREQAKDLEVAAWLVEGLVREHGFAGLRDGLRLATSLAEKYWDGLFPMPDEDGMARRVAGLGGLDGTIVMNLNTLPLTEGTTSGPYSLSAYQQAAQLEQVTDPERRQKRIDAGAVPLDTFKLAVRETPAEFFRTLNDDLRACDEQVGKLYTLLEGKCGAELTPPMSDVKQALRTCIEVLESVAKDKLAATAEGAAGEQGGAEGQAPAAGDGSGKSTGMAAGGAVKSREDAFREILRIAEFFKRTEPQGLVWYALEQAVRWGRMPLPELLAEFVPDDSGRTRFTWLGIKQESTAPEGSAS